MIKIKERDNMDVAMVLGIRPDWIMNSILIEKLDSWLGKDFKLIHTGQHYSYNMDKIFFDELGIREPDYHLNIGSGSHSYQNGETIKKAGKILEKLRPDVLLVFSDANPVLSAIAATKLGIKVCHLEAGMRSWDWRMPEEKNRRIVDSISDYLFTPTRIAHDNLVREGVRETKIHIVGKQVVEVLDKFDRAIESSVILEKLGLEENKYLLVTAHRPENVENERNLKNILTAIGDACDYLNINAIFPAHPRTQKAIKKFEIKLNPRIKMIDYLGFFDFSKLEKYARILVTDSGTVEEDGCWYHVPVVTFRISTERPETEECGANAVVGVDRKAIFVAIIQSYDKDTRWECPYHLGAADKIVSVLKSREDEMEDEKIWW